MNGLSRRLVNTAGFLVCAAMLAYALYSQHVLGLEPCPLCILQRVAVIGLGLVFLVAAIHDPGATGRAVYLAVATIPAASGIGVAGRQLWLQSLPPDKVPACGPGLDFIMEAFPLREALAMVLTGSGECAKVTWRMLGISMPGWVLIGVAGLWFLFVWNTVRRAAS